MDDPIPGSWWWSSVDDIYYKIIGVVPANHFMSTCVEYESYTKNGTLQPIDTGMSITLWTTLVHDGNIKLIRIPPFLETILELEEPPELVVHPTEPQCTKCSGREFTLYKGPIQKEHRWVCRKCLYAFDPIEYSIIGGSTELIY